MARQTSGMTGADLANICNEAAIFAGRDHRDYLLTRDFEAALERVVAGMQSRRVITDHEKKVVAYHEAGHALCSEMLPSVQKVHRISIIPRGRALGYTLNLPEEDRYLKSREELLDYMVVLLAGRVTEHIIFGQITTGASDDLHKVHEISRSMVTQYGMGTELATKQLPADDYSMSDHTRRMIDEEQQYLTDLAHRRAMKIVGENRELLEALAKTLLENEVLERDDITRLVAEHRGTPGPGREGALRTAARARRRHGGRVEAARGSAGRRLALVVLDLVLPAEPHAQAAAVRPALERADLAGVGLEHHIGLAGGAEGQEAQRSRPCGSRSGARPARRAGTRPPRPARARANRPACAGWGARSARSRAPPRPGARGRGRPPAPAAPPRG